MAHTETNVSINMPFVRKSNLFRTEKAYGSDVFTDAIPTSNIKTHFVEGIRVRDIRPDLDHFNFQKDGFEIVKFQSSLQERDWLDQEKVESVYCNELGEFMKNFLGAVAIQVFDAQVRRRHSSFPHSFVDSSVGYQPAMRPHVDASKENTIEKIRILNGEMTDSLIANRWVYLNVWKPIKGPIRDWPLAICDPKTVSESEDILEVDNIIRGEYAENLGLHHNPSQQWLYLNDHMPEELLLMRQADSEGSTGVPHASFDLPPALAKDAEPRESVEIRLIAYFSDNGK